MKFLRNISGKIRARSREDRGVVLVMTTLFISTVGVVALISLATLGRVSASKAYVDGISRNVAYGSVQLLVDPTATSLGAGGVTLSNDNTAIQRVVNNVVSGQPGIGGAVYVFPPYNGNTHINNLPYTAGVNQQESSGGGCSAPYCWREVGTPFSSGAAHYSSGVEVGATVIVPIMDPALLGLGASLYVTGSGSADWTQTCASSSAQETTC